MGRQGAGGSKRKVIVQCLAALSNDEHLWETTERSLIRQGGTYHVGQLETALIWSGAEFGS